MKKALYLCIAVLSLVCVIPTAEARTYIRWCSAVFRIIPFATGLDPVADTVRLEPFSARASGGGYIPNTIRLRAYRRARDCINSAWADPLSGSVSGIPAQCTNDGGNGIYGYNPSPSLLGDMANTACHAWGPEYRGMWVPVRIVADIYGDWGCGGSRTRKSTTLWPTEGSVLSYDSYYWLWVPSRCDT